MLSSERLKGITAFVYTADAGSFTAAALRLNLTSSAVSKSVARLEGRLGVVLFERTTRTLRLSDAGRAYYETCTRVLQELAEAEAVLAQQKPELAGVVRIGAPASYGRLCVMPVLLDFCARYPQLHPHIGFTDRVVDLIEENIDVAVRIGAPNGWPASLGLRHLGDERLIFCAAPDYLARRGAPLLIADLEQHDCIVYSRPDGSVGPWLFASGGGVERHPVRAHLAVGDAESQTKAVVAGLGIAQLATWLVERHLRSGALAEVLPAFATDGLPLHLVWPLARQLTPKIDALLRILEAQLRIR